MKQEDMVPCIVCGKLCKNTGRLSTCSDECFTDHYWMLRQNVVQNDDLHEDMLSVRIDGKQYFISPERHQRGEFRGCGGRKFIIQFTKGPNEGKVVETTNLWVNGQIPDRFRNSIFDNAEFKSSQEVSAVCIWNGKTLQNKK